MSNTAVPPAEPALSNLRLGQEGTRVLNLRAWSAITAICGLLFAWKGRNYMNADGVSYLDIASQTLQHGPSALINGYWSPLYPALLARFMSFGRSFATEATVIHIGNWIIFVVAILSFVYFLRGWRLVHMADRDFEVFAFALFIWSANQLIRLSEVTPDLCVMAIVFFAVGLCCRLFFSEPTLRRSLLLGLTLALAYYAKAAMLPAGLLLLLVFLCFPPGIARFLKQVTLAGLAFLAASLPLIILISQKIGHWSMGEAGTLNYLWYVNRVHPFNWTGADASSGTLAHPLKILTARPLAVEFGSPLEGTYPLWFDPSYWYEGVKTHFNLEQQISALETNLRVYLGTAYDMIVLIAGAIVLLSYARRKAITREIRPTLWSIIWPLSVFAMYGLVHVENRFLGPFVVLFWLGLYQAIGSSVHPQLKPVVFKIMTGALLLTTAMDYARPSVSIDNAATASNVRDLGVRSGDRLAIVGPAFDFYYARLAGVRVTAQVDKNEYWLSSPAVQHQLHSALLAAHIRGLIATDVPVALETNGWRRVGAQLWLMLLDDQPRAPNSP